MTPWLSVVGVGADGIGSLSNPARTLIDDAEILIGGARHLAMVPDDHPAQRHEWASPICETITQLQSFAGRRVVVLATGDPMHFGIGVTLARAFGREAMTILPAPGAFSLAAAHLGWALHETGCLTVHGRPMESLNAHIAPGARLLILSEDGTTPAAIAASLCERGYGPSIVTVLESMGAGSERIRECRAGNWNLDGIADLNTVGVLCQPGDNAIILSRAAGLPDDAFAHDGQMTKRVVRAATVASLAPQPGEHLWDLGAGCGSVAIEWMRLGGIASAVERDPNRRALIARNAAALGTPTLAIIADDAMTAVNDLAPPQAVFIGGGIATPGLPEACWNHLPKFGRLVANAVTVEGEAVLQTLHENLGGSLTRIAVSGVAPIGRMRSWQPMRPVTQFAVTKS